MQEVKHFEEEITMYLDASGYLPPIMCNAVDCDAEAVVERYVQRPDGVVSLDLRACQKHDDALMETGHLTLRGDRIVV